MKVRVSKIPARPQTQQHRRPHRHRRPLPPGQMEFIASFINRKHGRETVEYPHRWLEELLQPTYGIMVYQEQIMLSCPSYGRLYTRSSRYFAPRHGKEKPEEMAKQRSVFGGAMKKEWQKKSQRNI
ncbi:MAG: hypothetical protein IPL35_17595 [Sphingobacteriales bacterium]|nr:hypothetical protein [Sphingobacteriales bacterium]